MSDMIFGKLETEVLAGLHPPAVVGYLRSKGWVKVRDYGQNGAIFGIGRGDQDQLEVIVPVERNARDYVSSMQLLVADLAKFEDRPDHDLLLELATAGFDVIKIRSLEADDIGSIKLSAGVELHERARDMVLAAANVVASGVPRATWRGRRFENVESYAAALRLGQSQRGSFVISLLSPWEFSSEDDRILGALGLNDTPPFGRRAVRALGQALEATAKALRAAATEDPFAAFQSAVAHGVSANFCQSLAEIARDGEGADISIRWSYNKPEASEPILRLSRDDSQILIEAAQKLAEAEPVLDLTLEGVVTQIKEEPGAFDGVTTIEAPVDGRLRRVKVTFDANDAGLRDTLIHAFKERRRVSVTGDLRKEGRRLILDRPRSLVTREEGDEF